MITHDLGVVAGLCDEVNVLYGGRVVERADRHELFDTPRHPYTHGLLESIPRLDAPPGERLHADLGSVNDNIPWTDGCAFAPRCGNEIDACREVTPELVPRHGRRHLLRCHNPVEPCGCGGRAPTLDGRAGDPASPGSTGDRIVSDSDAEAGGITAMTSSRTTRTPRRRPMRRRQPTLRTARPTAARAVAATADADVLLEVNDLKVHFPIKRGVLIDKTVGYVYAVDGVSLAVRRGETYGLVGESGCGKSTLGRGILRLVEPTAGSVIFDGENIAALKREAAAPGPAADADGVPGPAVLARPAAVGAVDPGRGDEGARPGRLGQQQTNARLRELLSAVGLPNTALRKYPHEFSGGQRQRIGIARALTVNPELIVADEPVSALDVSVQAQVINLLEDLQRDLGLTYLVIAHDLAVVRHISDRVGVMYLGALVEEAIARGLYAEPLHPYIRALLSAVPVPDPVVEDSRERILLTGDLPSPANPPTGCRFHTRCPWRQPTLCDTDRPELDRARSRSPGGLPLRRRDRVRGPASALRAVRSGLTRTGQPPTRYFTTPAARPEATCCWPAPDDISAASAALRMLPASIITVGTSDRFRPARSVRSVHRPLLPRWLLGCSPAPASPSRTATASLLDAAATAAPAGGCPAVIT